MPQQQQLRQLQGKLLIMDCVKSKFILRAREPDVMRRFGDYVP
jgi:hypothetical protein